MYLFTFNLYCLVTIQQHCHIILAIVTDDTIYSKAVTRMYNDLLLAADSGHVSALCLLDLTDAFDTVDHDLGLLTLRLERQFGLRGIVLQWF